MRILLISAYDAPSHRVWHEGLRAKLPEVDFTFLKLKPRRFAWRMRANALVLHVRYAEALADDYDAIVCTSMTDLAGLRALCPRLAQLPAMVYFHENQFDYPDRRQARHALDAQMMTVFTALAGEQLVFNSVYNRDTFLRGVEALLRQMPERWPAPVVETLRERCRVLSVPLDLQGMPTASDRQPLPGRPLRLLWHHRWEFDKGPERLLAILRGLRERGIQFELLLCGQRFRQWPEAFDHIRSEFATAIAHDGFVEEREDYWRLLASADVALSTSLHEFQGLAMIEAANLGCVPLVPDRLSYQEIFAEEFRYASSPEDIELEAKTAVNRLQHWLSEGLPMAPAMGDFGWQAWRETYLRALRELSGQTRAALPARFE